MYFPESSETRRQDLGTVVLPNGKKKLSELVKGDLVTINHHGSTKPHVVEYLEHCP